LNNVILRIIDHDKCNKNYDKNEAINLKNNMYKRSIKTNERPMDIVISELKVGSPLIIKELPKIKVLSDKITEFRKRMNQKIVSGDIPQNIKYTYSNELFLHFDSGINDPERFLIFTTETHLGYLNKANFWFCDGTFRSCPRSFSQIYVIMADVKGCLVPLVYVFMKNKSKTSYINVFKLLKSRMKEDNI
ncbi:hypothetical protein DMUE_5921, partial [Dictyocoela muelleri]